MSDNLAGILYSSLEGSGDVDAAMTKAIEGIKAAANPGEPTPEPNPEPEKPAEPAPDAAVEETVVEPEPSGEPEPTEEPQAEADPREALFAQLRAKFPNESYEATGRRVEAALGAQESDPALDDGDAGKIPAIENIWNEYNQAQNDFKTAQEAMDALEADAEEHGAVLEFNKQTRETFEAVQAAKAKLDSAWEAAQNKAFAVVGAEFPEFLPDAPDSVAMRLFRARVNAASLVNENFDAHDPTLLAYTARQCALEARELSNTLPAAPQPPKPAPPRKAAPASRMPSSLPGSVQAPNAPVGSPANGQPVAPNIADLVRNMPEGASFNSLLPKLFGPNKVSWAS